MKIRAGFVSNSSSSSFILSTKTYETVFDAALAMLEVRTQDNWPDCPEKPMIIKAKSLGIDPDTAVTFRTCNYDTFIFRHKGQIYVSTCNNHPWWDHLDYVSQGGGHDNGEFRDLERKIYFWHIAFDIMGKPVTRNEWKNWLSSHPDIEKQLANDGYYSYPRCWAEDRHWCDPVRTPHGEIICPRCYQEQKRHGMLVAMQQYKGILAPVKKRVKLR